jgi:hypothetical protein
MRREGRPAVLKKSSRKLLIRGADAGRTAWRTPAEWLVAQEGKQESETAKTGRTRRAAKGDALNDRSTLGLFAYLGGLCAFAVSLWMVRHGRQAAA